MTTSLTFLDGCDEFAVYRNEVLTAGDTIGGVGVTDTDADCRSRAFRSKVGVGENDSLLTVRLEKLDVGEYDANGEKNCKFPLVVTFSGTTEDETTDGTSVAALRVDVANITDSLAGIDGLADALGLTDALQRIGDSLLGVEEAE